MSITKNGMGMMRTETANAQDQYGVKIVYTRHIFGEGGEYTIDDWGVFNCH